MRFGATSALALVLVAGCLLAVSGTDAIKVGYVPTGTFPFTYNDTGALAGEPKRGLGDRRGYRPGRVAHILRGHGGPAGS